MTTATCTSCGAPDDGELVICKFCQRPLSEEILRWAIPCPRCANKNRWGKQRCLGCGVWIVVSCLFCGALSPCSMPACLACKEPFAGAAERRAAQARAVQQREVASAVNTWGPLAGGFLGAIAGGVVAEGLSSAYHGHYHPSWDASSGDYGGNTDDDSPPLGGDVDTGDFSDDS
jgi:hypothetical protein